MSDPLEALAAFVLAEQPGDVLPIARAPVYRRLVRNTLREVLKSSLPITRKVLGEEGFEALFSRFLAAGGPKTSFYHAIPGDLVSWALETEEPQADLMHYEWIELLAARHPADLDAIDRSPSEQVRPNPTMQLGIYLRPVHQISESNPTPEPLRAPSAYLVWRRPVTDQVVFHRAGLLIARVIELASEQPLTAAELVERARAEAPGIDRAELHRAVGESLAQLAERDGVL